MRSWPKLGCHQLPYWFWYYLQRDFGDASGVSDQIRKISPEQKNFISSASEEAILPGLRVRVTTDACPCFTDSDEKMTLKKIIDRTEKHNNTAINTGQKNLIITNNCITFQTLTQIFRINFLSFNVHKLNIFKFMLLNCIP